MKQVMMKEIPESGTDENGDNDDKFMNNCDKMKCYRICSTKCIELIILDQDVNEDTSIMFEISTTKTNFQKTDVRKRQRSSNEI